MINLYMVNGKVGNEELQGTLNEMISQLYDNYNINKGNIDMLENVLDIIEVDFDDNVEFELYEVGYKGIETWFLDYVGDLSVALIETKKGYLIKLEDKATVNECYIVIKIEY